MRADSGPGHGLDEKSMALFKPRFETWSRAPRWLDRWHNRRLPQRDDEDLFPDILGSVSHEVRGGLCETIHLKLLNAVLEIIQLE